jgi:hypothetical protein
MTLAKELGVHHMGYAEAFKWLRTPSTYCPVRRASWNPDKHVGLDEGGRKVLVDLNDPGHTIQYAPTHEDEIATDWEISYVPYAKRPALEVI